MIDELDTWREDRIKCPYCGYIEGDSWEFGKDSTEYECPSCEKKSDLEVEIEVLYTTKRKGGS